jgi:hypothetical protein
MKINVKKVLADQELKKAKTKPLPRVIINQVVQKIETSVPETRTTVPKIKTPLSEKDMLLKDLWEQMHVVKVERGKLSSRTAYLVDEVAEKLKALRGQAEVDALFNGEIAIPELVEHRSKIRKYEEEGKLLYSKINHVKLYGKLPEVISMDPATLMAQETTDTKALKYDLRRLDKLISKTQNKAKSGKPKNPSRIATWNEKISLAEAEREEIRRKIKRIEYDGRTERNNS